MNPRAVERLAQAARDRSVARYFDFEAAVEQYEEELADETLRIATELVEAALTSGRALREVVEELAGYLAATPDIQDKAREALRRADERNAGDRWFD